MCNGCAICGCNSEHQTKNLQRNILQQLKHELRDDEGMYNVNAMWIMAQLAKMWDMTAVLDEK